MVYKVVVQRQAEEDIGVAYAYIAERAPEAATRWLARIEDEIGALGEMPGQSPLAPEGEKLQITLRQRLFGKRSGIYRIIFRILEGSKEVHVLTVRHGARKPISMEDL